MRLAAHAKINLTLEVLGTRPDGYHDLRSVVTTIPLHDDVELLDAPAGEVTVEMEGDGMEVPRVPCEANLAVRAARALQEACGVARGVHIRIVKRIPVGAGLGGGSADAAAVLNGLNEMWGLGLPKERLCAIGAEVGSDVPALVLGGTVLMEGRGERVRRAQSACPTMGGSRSCATESEWSRFVLRIPPVSSARRIAGSSATTCSRRRAASIQSSPKPSRRWRQRDWRMSRCPAAAVPCSAGERKGNESHCGIGQSGRAV